jgi:release factor glutamine methyltransferase
VDKLYSKISSALQWGINRLQESGVDNPRLDAEVLLAHCLKTDRVKLYVFYDKRLDRKDWERYTKYIEIRAKRKPVAYITGFKEFHSLRFRLTQAVLIPRPETEILVEEALKECVVVGEKKHPLGILELGTGSGVISVILAKEMEYPSIIATDISFEIVKVARENLRLYKGENKVNFLVSRYLQAIKVKENHFDLIISNPPYLSESDWENVQPEIKEYEPPDALLGGEDGLDFYRIIIPDVSRLLKYDGWLMLEVGMGQVDEVSKMIKVTGEFRKIELVNDFSGITRVVKAQK